MRHSSKMSAHDKALDDRARLAFAEARRMRRGLVAAARVFTGNPKLQIDFHASRACTDGVDKIWLRVPIELADLPEHEPSVCQTRDSDFIQRCRCCAILEDVQITLLHEIAHIVHDTFEKVSAYERANILRAAVDAECNGDDTSSRAAKIKARIERAPKEQTSDYLNLLNLVSPFLPVIFNACEDVRVNGNMMQDLPGTEVMFRAQTNVIFKHGFSKHDGSTFHWKDAEPNPQAIIAVYCKVMGFDYRPWLDPDLVNNLEDAELDALCDRVREAKSARSVYKQCFPLLERLRALGYCKAPDDPENDPEPPPPPPEEEEPETPSMNQEPDGSEGDEHEDSAPSEDDDQSSGEQPEEGDDDSTDSESGDGADPGQDSDPEQEHGDDEDSAGDSEPDEVPPEVGDGDADPSDDEGLTDDDDTEDSNDAEDGDEADGGSDAGEPEDEADGEDAGEDPGGDTGEPADDPDGEDSDGEASADDGSDPEDSEEPGDGTEDGSDPAEGDGDSPSPEAGEDLTEGTGDPSDSDTEGTADGDAEGDPGDPSSDPSDTGQENPLDGPDSSQDGAPGPEEGSGDTDAPAGDPGPDTAGKEQGESDTPEPYTAEQMEQDGTPSDMERLLNIFGGHADKNPPETPMTHSEREEEYDLQEAIERVSEQIDVFDRPSINIGTLKVIKYDDPQDSYRSPWAARRDRSSRDLIHVSEGILMNALQKLRLAFQDNKKSSMERHRRSGRIDTRVLGKRITVGDDRLFQKKRQPGKKDYFVVVGLDCSGSTARPLDGGGSRWDPNGPVLLDMMKAACAAKCELLNRLGVRFAVYAHSGDTTAVEIFEIKSPDEKWTPKCQRALAELQPYSANLDGHTMEFYRKVAQSGRETDRVILYYTDGAMPLENYDEELEILQDEIRTCQKLGIDLVAIGVRNDDPIEHGLDTIRLDEVEDIPRVVEGLRKRLQQ